MSENKFDSAAEWAERDMTLPADSPSALRGAAAAAFGRDLVERASNGEPAIDPRADSQH